MGFQNLQFKDSYELFINEGADDTNKPNVVNKTNLIMLYIQTLFNQQICDKLLCISD